MGVSGSGKTTVGMALSNIISVPFYDADSYHSEENIRKMRAGFPLTDEDRKNWLFTLSLKMKEWGLQGDAILACSALKKHYRRELSRHVQTVFIFLDGEYDLIYQRLASRSAHFFRESMLKSQFSDLDRPEDCISVSIDQPVALVCSNIIEKIEKVMSAK